MIAEALQQYGIDFINCTIDKLSSGLINTTYKITYNNQIFILQKINAFVFKKPQLIADNINLLATYLRKSHPDYLFVAPIKTENDLSIICNKGKEYFRLFPFVKKSHTIDVALNPQQAYEAAKQFGAFTQKLSGFNCSSLKITLPNFHNISLRYQQFEIALLKGNKKRLQEAASTIGLIKSYKNIVEDFEKIKTDSDFKIRVTHHDTKISNVLFDANGKGLCVIDLDTVMPGYFISDVGDMLRTYVSPANEEEKDFSKIKIREGYVEAIMNGYLSEMENELSKKEKQFFIFAGKFMVYMQALRFLTDFLNDDVYYGSKYEGHNLVRAKNQLVLLQQF